MSWLTRLIGLLLLAGVFLLASFMGGMTHSIVAELTQRGHQAWWVGGFIGVIVLAGLAWRRFRRTSSGPSPDPRVDSPP